MHESYTEILPEQLKVARTLLKVKQQEVADYVGISFGAYANIENGKVDPKVSNYNKIIKFYRKKGILFTTDGNVKIHK